MIWQAGVDTRTKMTRKYYTFGQYSTRVFTHSSTKRVIRRHTLLRRGWWWLTCLVTVHMLMPLSLLFVFSLNIYCICVWVSVRLCPSDHLLSSLNPITRIEKRLPRECHAKSYYCYRSSPQKQKINAFLLVHTFSHTSTIISSWQHVAGGSVGLYESA